MKTLLSPEDRWFIRKVVKPSWLSGLLSIVAGLVVAGGSIITFSLKHSAFTSDLLSWEQSRAHTTLSVAGQSTQNVNPSLANSWPLIIIWGFVGLLTYVIAAAIIRFILQTLQLRRELDYVHADPILMLKVTAEHIVMRIVAAILLICMTVFFIYRILPFAINAGHQSVDHHLTPAAAGYAVISFLLVTIGIHIGTILLRLLFGRARVYTSH